MDYRKFKEVILGAVTAIAFSSAVSAAPVYVGSWDLYSGSPWGTFTVPTYTGQEAAALLFGGSPDDYAISTLGNDPLTIDNMAWLDQIYIGVAKFAEDYRVDGGVLGVYDNPGDTSAWVEDNGCCGNYINYAFYIGNETGNEVPAPAALSLLGLGLAGLGMARRRK